MPIRSTLANIRKFIAPFVISLRGYRYHVVGRMERDIPGKLSSGRCTLLSEKMVKVLMPTEERRNWTAYADDHQPGLKCPGNLRVDIPTCPADQKSRWVETVKTEINKSPFIPRLSGKIGMG
jgi:hypothetical protein